MSPEEIFAKFDSCLQFGRDGCSPQRVRQAFDTLKNIETVEDVSCLPPLL
jgi:hypothetical protein